MRLIPVSLEKKIMFRLQNFITQRAMNLFSRGAYTKNGQWMQWQFETRAAYEAVLKNTWMYASIYTIASSAAMLPCGTYSKNGAKGTDYTLVDDDPITNLINNPNPFQTRSEFIEAIMWSLELSGKVFLECVPNKKNPKEIYVLDPRRMEVVPDEKRFVKSYLYLVNGKKEVLSLDSVIFHKYHNPTNEYEGLCGSTTAGDAINGDILSNSYNNAFFGNSGIPIGTLECERRLTDDEIELLRSQWEKSHKGTKNASRVAILFGGIKFNYLQRSPKDMEFSNQKKLFREEILAGYGVPPVLVGLLESVNYGNAKEQKKLFWQGTMTPKLRSLAERFTLEFGLNGTSRKFMFDLSGVDALQEDEEIKSRIAFNLSKSGFSFDEIRKRLYNMPPLPQGVGKFPWVPTNVVPANLQMNGPAVNPKAQVGSGQPGKPGGPSDSPGPEGQKPGAQVDAKPASNAGKKDAQLTKEDIEMFADLERRIIEEGLLDPNTTRQTILVG